MRSLYGLRRSREARSFVRECYRALPDASLAARASCAAFFLDVIGCAVEPRASSVAAGSPVPLFLQLRES